MDLDGARRIGFRVEQSFRYAYAAPVTALAQRLVVVPRRRHGDLHRRSHRLAVTGAAHARRVRQDAAGNTVVRVVAARVEQAVEFRLTATLDRVVDDGPPELPAAALRAPRALRATRLTEPDDALRELADRCRGADHRETAERACTVAHAALTYEYGVTSVRTTAAQALAGGRGVCQDSAHVMLAMCRLLGVPSRYVSGHLVGQGGTHAWVEVLVPHGDRAVALAFDPCHGRPAHHGYVTVAVGRDYADVAPTSGTYVGAPGGTLTGSREVTVVSVE
ncbi:transglutaminase domain-containing protein [Actinoplanes sp. NPDC049599]|uniref:transglutaminase family protein n=1 Tax=Actinoplanes sp. NPDC049599 TaxID=3363903 RepID=UPI0037BA47F7